MAAAACPLCGAPQAADPRYPRRVCAGCAAAAVSAAGRPLLFFNEDMSGGCTARYADTGEAYGSLACFIRGRRCVAGEAKFGGIVIQAE